MFLVGNFENHSKATEIRSKMVCGLGESSGHLGSVRVQEGGRIGLDYPQEYLAVIIDETSLFFCEIRNNLNPPLLYTRLPYK